MALIALLVALVGVSVGLWQLVRNEIDRATDAWRVSYSDTRDAHALADLADKTVVVRPIGRHVAFEMQAHAVGAGARLIPPNSPDDDVVSRVLRAGDALIFWILTQGRAGRENRDHRLQWAQSQAVRSAVVSESAQGDAEPEVDLQPASPDLSHHRWRGWRPGLMWGGRFVLLGRNKTRGGPWNNPGRPPRRTAVSERPSSE